MYLKASCLLLSATTKLPTSFILLYTRNKYTLLIILPLYFIISSYKIKPMKPKTLCCFFILFLFFTLEVSATSARPLVQTPKGDDKPKQILEGVSDSKLEDNNNSIDKLMGIESCEEGDEECLKRRLLSEAHLDYIYTQHQKP